MVNLLADLSDARFSQASVHHALEALDRRGLRPIREHRTPERILGWIDAEFGGTWSREAAAGGIWIAESDAGPIGFAAYDARGLAFHWLRAQSRDPSTGLFGPFGVTPAARDTGIGTTLLHAALFSLRERGYRRALIPAVQSPQLAAYYAHATGAQVAEEFDLARGGRRWRATVLASGNGSNFQAVVDGAAAGTLPLDVVALVVNRPHCYALQRAARAGIETHVVAWNRTLETRAAFDARVTSAVARTEPELVLLLGWMHVLPPDFIRRFPQILNVHPAFLPHDQAADRVTMPDGSALPVFRGARAFDDALVAGFGWSGASVHRVGEAVDRGIVLARAPLKLDAREPRSLSEERLHGLEREVVACAVRSWSYEQP